MTGASPQHAMLGASLLEVLISLVIASMGILALAGSHAAAIRYAKMSQYRGTATQLANDLAERMRANKAGMSAYALTTTFADQADVPNLHDGCVGYAGAACSALTLADFDLTHWRRLVRDQLPEGSAYVLPHVVQNAMDVWVIWRDPELANADETPTLANACHVGLALGDDTSVRCSYFRINL